jgi:pyridinium-3,5-biscarboxylic acid mononucleotide sulfurtransferase
VTRCISHIGLGLFCKHFFVVILGEMGRINLQDKRGHLVEILTGINGLAVAFSGGVDSTYLLAVAHQILGRKVIAVTADSPIYPSREKNAATDIATRLGVRHIVIQSRELEDPEFLANKRNRCYVCKKRLFEDIFEIARKESIATVVHGANADDHQDFRPGFAAARELGVLAPLVDAGLTKEDIRRLSREMGLPTWQKPAMACLATRIPYDTRISVDALEMIDRAENIVVQLGFAVCRVRHHGSVARIEVAPSDMEKILDDDIRSSLIRELRQLGFPHVAIDLEGYVQGSMNRDGRPLPDKAL